LNGCQHFCAMHPWHECFVPPRGANAWLVRHLGFAEIAHTERGSYNAPKNYDCGTRETPAPHPSRISKHQKNVPALVRFNFHFFPLVLCCVLRFLWGAGCVVGRNILVRCSFHYRCAFFLLKCGFSRLRNCAICGFGHCAKIFKIRVTTPFEEFAP